MGMFVLRQQKLLPVFLLYFLIQYSQARSELLTEGCNVLPLPEDEVAVLNVISDKLKWNALPFTRSACSNFTFLVCGCQSNTTGFSHVIELRLMQFYFEGIIPPEFANLKYLSVLDLSDNRLTEHIPSSLGSLPLVALDLSHNKLDGPIPSELGNLRSLIELKLDMNQLSGPIPNELGNMTSLKHLAMGSNQLSGLLPSTLGHLYSLQTLDLSWNNFSGPLPHGLANLSSLTSLNLDNNYFSGPIPDSIGGFQHLSELTLRGSNLEGPVPISISNLINLTVLEISDLIIRENATFPFPLLSNMKKLQILTLRGCSISGEIPNYIGEMPDLEFLDLSFNYLFGGIPRNISQLNLRQMFLSGNVLNGSIPSWVSNSSDLVVDLSENKFSQVNITRINNRAENLNLFSCCSSVARNLNPSWLSRDFCCANRSLQYNYLHINCGGTNMTVDGTHYEADLQPNGASTFYLSSKGNWGYSSEGLFDREGEIGKYILDNRVGVLTTDTLLFSTARVAPLSLKYYGFCLLNGTYMVKLFFAEIIDKDDRNYADNAKRVFDVFIQGKRELKDFNINDEAGGKNIGIVRRFKTEVTNHRLEIHLYWAGKGSRGSPSPAYGPLLSAISVTSVMPEHDKIGKIIAAIAVSVCVLLILLASFLGKKGWIGAREIDIKCQELFPGEFFSLRDIKTATGNFSSESLIGEGGSGIVYKAVLSGKVVAVKKLSAKSKQSTQEFLNEMRTICGEHPNIIKLLGYFVHSDKLLLIYEYMENKSLKDALLGHERKLDWKARCKICLGIAKGLEFLQGRKIVHRDIKASNILLDRDFNPKISDFGLAKLFGCEQTHHLTRIIGTRGYVAPEYAMWGYLTEKLDVYSFGIVVLETVSGRNNADYLPNAQRSYLLDEAFVHRERGNLQELVDETARGANFSSEEANRVLNVALLCTKQSPSLRPTMSEVVSLLEGKELPRSPSFVPRRLIDERGYITLRAYISRAIQTLETSMDYDTSSAADDGNESG